MDPQNGILVGRDIIVPSPAPLQLERDTGGQAPLQLWHNVMLETRSVPIKVKAGRLVSDNGGRQEVIRLYPGRSRRMEVVAAGPPRSIWPLSRSLS